MILTPVHPVAGAPLEVGAPGTREALCVLYRRDSGACGVRVNVIASVDGSVQGVDGTSETLSSRADRAILGAIRAESDAVLIGASTLRQEGYLVPRTARLAVLTRTGDLAGAEAGDGTDPGRILVLGPESARDRAAETLPAPHEFLALPADVEGSVSPADVLDALRSRGIHEVVCEGGASVIAAFAQAGLVGEFCVSTSPQWLGGGTPLLGSAPRTRTPLRLASLLADDAGGVYARWIAD